MAARTPEGGLFCALAWRRPGRPVWLALDLPGAVRVREIADPDHDPLLGPGSVLIAATGTECRELAGGGLLVGGGAFWPLVDPLDPQAPTSGDDEDQIAVETALRHAARRFSERVHWYRSLEQTLRDAVRRDLQGGAPSLAPLLDHLDHLSLQPASPPMRAPMTAITPPRPCPPDPDGIRDWMCDRAGLGAIYGADWAPRQEQAAMAHAVAQALAGREPLLVEAGTGVGKTLAYLVPLAATIAAQGKRAVVSTHTRALQSQVLSQDLPRLQALLGTHRFRLLMGRRNYLCLRQERAFLTRPVEDLADGLRTAALRLWLAATDDGLREELANHPLLQSSLSDLFDAADLCLPGLCWDGDRCHVQRARRRAREADILVVNHALLLHDLRAGRTLLGDYDALVIDEAHRLPAVTLETHAVVCGLRRLTDLDDALGAGSAGSAHPRLELAARRLEERGEQGARAAAGCRDFGRALSRMQGAFRLWWQAVGEQLAQLPATGQGEAGRVRLRDKDAFFAPLRPLTSAVLEDAAAAAAAQASLAAAVGDLDDLGPALEDDLAQVALAGQVVRQLEQDVAFLSGAPDDGWVTWVEPARGRPGSGARAGASLLGATLLEAGGVLREAWQDADLRPVVTSATLAVGEDFTLMLDELGLSRRRPNTRTLTCPSPFDYHEQCRILMPARFPDPQSTGFDEAVGATLALLARGMPRKTMALFTSYRAIRVAQDVLAAHGFDDLTGGGGPVVLAQSPRTPAAAILEQFKRLPRALLLGTATFWEGVDFPGDDLEVLIVAKLPFLVPSDPWVEARCERLQATGENPFTAFMVRDAVLRLRQGFGRLIRRTGDRGVVLILDNRLHTKNYGTTFLGALPTVPVTYGDEADLLARLDAFFGRSPAREPS
jgi:ATP-dependent DNA helicase DinG